MSLTDANGESMFKSAKDAVKATVRTSCFVVSVYPHADGTTEVDLLPEGAGRGTANGLFKHPRGAKLQKITISGLSRDAAAQFEISQRYHLDLVLR